MKSFHTYNISKEHAGITVEEYLKQILQYSGRRMQKLTRAKGIRLNNKTVFLQKKLKADDSLRILILEDAGYGVQSEEGPVDILYEDDCTLVINKPIRQLVHPTAETKGATLANYVAYYLQQCGIVCSIRPVHRLDRDTSGCIIFAKDGHSQSLLEQQLKTRILKRTYWALVKGTVNPPTGTINAPIGADPNRPNRRLINEKGEQAITHYRTIDSFPDYTLLELSLDTGRTHQIRLHAAHIGHPIVGDNMYGLRCSWMKRQALHAESVTFTPLKGEQQVQIHAPLPDDFTQAINHCMDLRNSILD